MMGDKNAEFLKKLRDAFHREAEERLIALSRSLIELEKIVFPEGAVDLEAPLANGPGKGLVESIYREVHSLKGAGRTVNLRGVETVCQELESALLGVKQGKTPLDRDLFDLLHEAADVVGALTRAAAGKGQVPADPVVRDLLARLAARAVRRAGNQAPAAASSPAPRGAVESETSDPSVASPPDPGAAPERPFFQSIPVEQTVRISSGRLNTLLLGVEELLSMKNAAHRRCEETRGLWRAFSQWKKGWTEASLEWLTAAGRPGRTEQTARTRSRAGHDEPDEGCGLPGGMTDFLGECQDRFQDMERRLRSLRQAAERDKRDLGRMVDDLLRDMKQALMLPFASLFEAFPKMVRDLARAQGKDVRLDIRGGGVEIDRRILDELKDPFTHILRNCVDHGIESPDIRRSLGKPEHGTVRVEAVQRGGGKVVVIVSDDGAGIDPQEVLAAAVRRGMVLPREAEAMSRERMLDLIFVSGVSTSRILTEVSGRGLGMAIVREKVERVGGSIAMDATPGRGAVLTMTTPTAMTSFKGIVVMAGGREFVAPKSGVERVIRLAPEDVRGAGERETVALNGKPATFSRLTSVLGIAPLAHDRLPGKGVLPALVLASGEARTAILVDAVTGEEDVMLKGLGRQLRRVRNIAGVAMLGAGRLAPVLHMPDVFKSAQRRGLAAVAAQGAPKDKKKQYTALVAEDSITSRLLLKSILESAGYRVLTAVDGADALAVLRLQEVDALVSDIEMPRLDGFELTRKVRADPALASLPVVLVTSLANREHQERGADAGADAYLVKSSFDQSNLLDILSKLL